MRTFTDKDIQGLCRALQTFMSHCSGTQLTVKTIRPQVELALSEGLTVDEILNPCNYERAKDLVASPRLDEYVDILVHNRIATTNIKEERNWNGWDDKDNLTRLAEWFHDFYTEICPKGGTWSTRNALLNFRKAIYRNTLQGIMSEALIKEVMEKSGAGDKLTCFQFIQEILDNAEDYGIDNSPSESQMHRRDIETTAEEDEYAEASVDDIHENERIQLDTEGAPDPDDPSIYGDIDGTSEKADEGPGAFVSMPSPLEFKRAHVLEAIKEIQVKELFEFSRLFDEETSVDEFLTQLADGRFDKSLETIEARNAHQFLNGRLYQDFIECAAWQGVEISEETAAKMDILTTNWDLRDAKSRKLQKLKELIYSNAMENMEDMDLMSAIEDLERLYASESSDEN